MKIASLAGDRRDWRRRMRAELLWIFLLKLAALTLLWLLFFSAADRAPPDGNSVSRQLGIVQPPASSRSVPAASMKEMTRG
ncbi:MAG: hypothetical protein KGL45_11420 [Gammaproteobacteria bacterium]|nr:hypothetical protein [Gammaproteobacteria bacterium]